MKIYRLLRNNSSLLVEIGVAPPKNYAGAANPPRTFLALVDTGAEASVISPHVARLMMTPELGRQPVLLSGNRISFDPIHDILIRLGGHLAEGPWHSLVVTNTAPATPNVDVILGMDILLATRWGWDGRDGSGWIAD